MRCFIYNNNLPAVLEKTYIFSVSFSNELFIACENIKLSEYRNSIIVLK